jgi:hypothetical protein
MSNPPSKKERKNGFAQKHRTFKTQVIKWPSFGNSSQSTKQMQLTNLIFFFRSFFSKIGIMGNPKKAFA